MPAKVRDYVFTGVGLSVCLFVCLLPRELNKTWTDLDEIFWEGSLGEKQAQVRFWLRSLAGCGSYCPKTP